MSQALMFHFCSMSRAHGLRPGLGAEHAHLQRELGDVELQLLGHVPEVEGEAGRAAEDGGAEVLHEHELALGVAARDGDDRGAEASAP